MNFENKLDAFKKYALLTHEFRKLKQFFIDGGYLFLYENILPHVDKLIDDLSEEVRENIPLNLPDLTDLKKYVEELIADLPDEDKDNINEIINLVEKNNIEIMLKEQYAI